MTETWRYDNWRSLFRRMAPTHIVVEDIVYSDLPTSIIDVLDQILCAGDNPQSSDLVCIQKLDARAVEVVYFDDVKQADGRPSYVYEGTREWMQDEISKWFGDHWRVRRKDYDVKARNHPQRMIIERVDRVNFRYSSDSVEEAEAMRVERPDGVPDDVDTYGDLEHVVEVPDRVGSRYVDRRADVFTIETASGSKHLVPGRDLCQAPVGAVVESYCGHEFDHETILDEHRVRHYARYLLHDHGEKRSDIDDPSPDEVLGDDLCQLCWRSYGDPKTSPLDGSVTGHVRPIRQRAYWWAANGYRDTGALLER